MRVTSRRPEGILRLAETRGQRQTVSLRFATPVAGASFLYERGHTDRPAIEGERVSFEMGPYEVVAVRECTV